MNSLKEVLKRAFSLTKDCASYEEIEKRIVSGGQIYGTNLCVMMLAIFVASIGLNMNSTAVIIGAMLISPLMGTIVSIGYGLATGNAIQMRNSAVGLFFQIVVCLTTATVYFKLSPISTAQSELLARTTPTIWDVLIAICGGTAGAIGITRKESSNVMPGVAIATALMPPLCTAGYGIAMGSLRYFSGAMYLFLINAYFICLSTCIVMLIIKVPVKSDLNEDFRRKLHKKVRNIAIILIIPSLFLGYQAVQHSKLDSDSNTSVSMPTAKEIQKTSSELKILYPQVSHYETGVAKFYNKYTKQTEQYLTATIIISQAMADNDINTMKQWLKTSTGVDKIYILEYDRIK